MESVLAALKDTPIPTLLVTAGIVFLLLSIAVAALDHILLTRTWLSKPQKSPESRPSRLCTIKTLVLCVRISSDAARA